MSSLANASNETNAPTQLAALGSMVDYAIVEGAQHKLPMFVFLLKLARLALLEASADPEFLDAAEESRIRQKLFSSRKERRSKNHEAANSAMKDTAPRSGKEKAGIGASVLSRIGGTTRRRREVQS